MCHNTLTYIVHNKRYLDIKIIVDKILNFLCLQPFSIMVKQRYFQSILIFFILYSGSRMNPNLGASYLIAESFYWIIQKKLCLAKNPFQLLPRSTKYFIVVRSDEIKYQILCFSTIFSIFSNNPPISLTHRYVIQKQMKIISSET